MLVIPSSPSRVTLEDRLVEVARNFLAPGSEENDFGAARESSCSDSLSLHAGR